MGSVFVFPSETAYLTRKEEISVPNMPTTALPMIKKPIGTRPAALPAENVMEAALKMFETMSRPRLPFYPVLDGHGLTAGYNSSIEQGMLHNVPFMAGSTRDDLRGEASSASSAADPENGLVHAVMWQNGFLTDLGTLGGPQSYPMGINDRGQVVGLSRNEVGYKHAFIWGN